MEHIHNESGFPAFGILVFDISGIVILVFGIPSICILAFGICSISLFYKSCFLMLLFFPASPLGGERILMKASLVVTVWHRCSSPSSSSQVYLTFGQHSWNLVWPNLLQSNFLKTNFQYDRSSWDIFLRSWDIDEGKSSVDSMAQMLSHSSFQGYISQGHIIKHCKRAKVSWDHNISILFLLLVSMSFCQCYLRIYVFFFFSSSFCIYIFISIFLTRHH